MIALVPLEQPWTRWVKIGQCYIIAKRQIESAVCIFPDTYLSYNGQQVFLMKTFFVTPFRTFWLHGPLARYVKLRVAHAPGIPGTFSPPLWVSDPDMHHGTCVTRVPWCMPGSWTSGFLWSWWREKTSPAFQAHAQPAILRIWQEAHGLCFSSLFLIWHLHISHEFSWNIYRNSMGFAFLVCYIITLVFINLIYSTTLLVRVVLNKHWMIWIKSDCAKDKTQPCAKSVHMSWDVL